MRRTNLHKKAFTLVELMVVITIMFILSMMVHAPYQHYQTKQKVRNSAKIVTQTLQEARNLAINGVIEGNGGTTGTGNTSIGILFASGSTNISLFAYPIKPLDDGTITTYSDYTDPIYELETKNLEQGVEVSGTLGDSLQNDALFIYEAISGSGSYHYFNPSKTDFSEDTDKKFEITIGLGGSTSGSLSKKIDYYSRTYVSDVQ